MISTVLYATLLITTNKYVLMAVVGLFGATLPLIFTVGFVYLLELMPATHQTFVSTLQNIVATFTVTGCALYFAWVSK